MGGELQRLPEVELNPRFLGYLCTVCGREQDRDHTGYVCPHCGIDGILDVRYDMAAVQRKLDEGGAFPAASAGGMWRSFFRLYTMFIRPRPPFSSGAVPGFGPKYCGYAVWRLPAAAGPASECGRACDAPSGPCISAGGLPKEARTHPDTQRAIF